MVAIATFAANGCGHAIRKVIGRRRAMGVDFFQQPGVDELIDRLAKRFARYVCRQVNAAIVTPRS
jgi:hypothetical protein